MPKQDHVESITKLQPQTFRLAQFKGNLFHSNHKIACRRSSLIKTVKKKKALMNFKYTSSSRKCRQRRAAVEEALLSITAAQMWILAQDQDEHKVHIL